jgi:hypothetical protein
MTGDSLSKADRDSLIRLVRQRAKVAKATADERKKVLLAEVDDLLTAEFQAQELLSVEAARIAQEAAQKANDQIRAQCALLGVPAKFAPELSLNWISRGADTSNPRRRAELRALAQVRLDAHTATAKTVIDERELDAETALVAGGLDSDKARAVMDSLPTIEDLMPSLALEDLGVKRWQPPTGAAGELLSPMTPTQRKRRIIRQLVEAHPDASDREIARLAGVDPKTVRATRRSPAELATATEEIPEEILTSTEELSADS